MYPSLARKQNWGFVRDRLLRLGLPFVFGVIFLVPIAEYPAYSVTAPDPSLADYFRSYLALPFVPNGQLWFLWQLLALNFIVTGLNFVAPNALKSLGRWSTQLGRRPLVYLAVLIAISTVAYVPLALAFTPWQWSDSGPLALQFGRPLLYGVYFFAGVGIGAGGIDEGLVAADGQLSKRWWLWLAAALAALFVWMGINFFDARWSGASWRFKSLPIWGLSWPAPAVARFLVAASLRFGLTRSRPLASLSANAYSLYLVHYVFIVWMQYALLALAAPAVLKAPIVFVVTLVVSWIIILAVQRIPLGARLIGMRPPPVGRPKSRDGLTIDNRRRSRVRLVSGSRR